MWFFEPLLEWLDNEKPHFIYRDRSLAVWTGMRKSSEWRAL
jgi:hypothetical protein